MSPTRILRGFLFGGIGGFLAWVALEFAPPPFPQPPFRLHQLEAMHVQAQAAGDAVRIAQIERVLTMTPTADSLIGIVLGLLIGGMLGVSDAMVDGRRSRFFRRVGLFLVFGALGGFLGLYFGHILWAALDGRFALPRNAAEFLRFTLARSSSWVLIGLFLGAAFGIPDLSLRRMWNGAVGGALGGGLGGFFFETLSVAQIFTGIHARLLGFVMIGAMIGFFINLIVEAMKRVWVKVLVGRNEGREYILDTPLAYTGRDELAELPVFLDPAVPKRMASFRQTGGRYALHPESDALQLLVNGQPVVPGQVLRDGDAIQFGRVTLGYFEKVTAREAAPRPIDNVPLADFSAPSVVPGATPLPNAPNVCEFCGQPRDPVTGSCACSVPADPYAAPAYAGAAADPHAGYADPYNGYAGAAPAGDPAYGATMLDPGPATHAAPAGGPCLVAVAGPYAGQQFVLPAEMGIGRDPSQDLPLPQDRTASRRHARIHYTNGSWFVRDEGSSNGTYVNGVRIQEQPIFPGDLIRVGQTEFRFEG
ncbi:MAG: FHA domain-containing protein [Armatimonadota bacterium]